MMASPPTATRTFLGALEAFNVKEKAVTNKALMTFTCLIDIFYLLASPASCYFTICMHF